MPYEPRCRTCGGKIITLHIGREIHIYCENCRKNTTGLHIPKNVLEHMFKRETRPPTIIDIKPRSRIEDFARETYLKLKNFITLINNKIKKIYARGKNMVKIEVVKKKSWFLINVLGQSIVNDNPELRDHLIANKSVKLTIETIEKKPEPEPEPEPTVEDYVAQKESEVEEEDKKED